MATMRMMMVITTTTKLAIFFNLLELRTTSRQ